MGQSLMKKVERTVWSFEVYACLYFSCSFFQLYNLEFTKMPFSKTFLFYRIKNFITNINQCAPLNFSLKTGNPRSSIKLLNWFRLLTLIKTIVLANKRQNDPRWNLDRPNCPNQNPKQLATKIGGYKTKQKKILNRTKINPNNALLAKG